MFQIIRRRTGFEGAPSHAHNRLLSSYVTDAGQRRQVARVIAERLVQATGPVTVFLPLQGCNEWDRAGGPLADAEGLAAFCEEMQGACPAHVRLVSLDAHINDAAFADAVLAAFDVWVAEGVVEAGKP